MLVYGSLVEINSLLLFWILLTIHVTDSWCVLMALICVHFNGVSGLPTDLVVWGSSFWVTESCLILTRKSDHETMPDFVVYLFFKTKARWWFLLALGIVRVIVFKYKSVFVFCFLHAFLHLSFKVTATFFIPSNLPKVNATYLFHASVKSTSVFLYWGFNSLFWTTEQVGERSTSKNFLFKIYHRGYRK